MRQRRAEIQFELKLSFTSDEWAYTFDEIDVLFLLSIPPAPFFLADQAHRDGMTKMQTPEMRSRLLLA
jgi:hypothetical protein